MVDYQEIIQLKSTMSEMNKTMITFSINISKNTVTEVWKVVQMNILFTNCTLFAEQVPPLQEASACILEGGI